MRLPLQLVPRLVSHEPDLQAAIASDHGHHAPLASHVFLRGEEIVGAAALCAPAITFWAHSKRCGPRDSFDLVLQAQTEAANRHEKFLCLCAADSPFRPHMGRFGFQCLGNADVFQMQRIPGL